MNWASQFSVAFQLLNNAALLAVGTLGYCELHRRAQARLPAWADALLCGSLFGALSILTALAPAVSGVAISLRFAPLIVAALWCGPAAGFAALTVLVLGSSLVLADNPALGIQWHAVLCYVLSIGCRLLLVKREASPRLRDFAIVGFACVVAMLAAAPLLWGSDRFKASFQQVGPAWALVFGFTVVGLGAIFRHVERSRALARAVSDNERRFRSFYNESPVMLTAVDSEDRIVAASDRWLEVMGYSREEVIGRSRYEFLTPPSGAQVRERVLPALREGRKLETLEVQLVRKDGGLVDVSATPVLRRDPVTGGEELLNFAIDQSARKEAERALAEREGQLRAIVDNAPVGIFLKDRGSRYGLVNQHFEQWIGASAEQVIGRSDADLVPDELARSIRAGDLEVLEHGTVYQTEREPTHPQRPGQHILVTKFPIRDEAGGITGIAGFAMDITERKEAETALAESERDLRAILDNAPFAIFLKDRMGRYRLVNRCYAEWFGRSLENVRGRTSAEIYGPEITEINARLDAEVLGEGRVAVLERARMSERTAIGHLQVTQFPIRDGRGEIVGSAGFCADVTERKRAETALRESQELLIEAQRLGRVGHIFVDRVAKRVRLSDSVFEIRGIPKRESFSFEEAIGFLRPEDRPRYEAERDAAIAAHRDFEIEVQTIRGDGTYGWEHSIGRPRYDAEGNVTGILIVLRDVTESKLAEEALRTKEAELRAILDNAPFAISLKDKKGRYRLINRRFTEWFGYRLQDVLGRTSAEIYPAEVAAISLKQDAEALNEGRISVVERPRMDERTSVGYLQITQFPIRDEHGEIAGSAGFCADISERKRAERALAESRDLLLESQRLGKVGYILSDLRSDRIYWSDSLFELRKVPRREYLTFTETMAFIHPEDVAEYTRVRNAAVAAQRDFEIDVRVRHGDGTVAWEHSVGHPRYDEAGNCVGVLVVLRDITEEKQTEQALRESRELLIQSQRLGKLGHVVSSRKTMKVYWSDTVFEMRGVPKREFFTFKETEAAPLVHPEDRPRFRAARDAGIAEHRDFELDIRVERPGGKYAWEAIIGRPRYDESGALESVLYVLQDITERKRADEALRRKEAELRAIMDNAPLSIFLKDREGRYRLVNRRYAEWMGRVPEQIYGRRSDEVFPPEVARGMLARDRDALENGTVSVAVVPTAFFDPKFGVEHALVTKFPVRDDAGAIVGMAGFAMDVTARKRAELALREAQHRLQTIMDNAPFAVFLKDREGRYQLINRTYTDWFGERPEEVVGRTVTELYDEEHAQSWAAADRRVVETGSIEEEKRRTWQCKPGLDYVRETKFPVRDESGAIVGVACFIADISAHERAETALRETQHRLQTIMDNAPFAIFLKDREGRYQLINRTYTKWFGDRQEDIVGRTAAEVFPSDQARRWEASDSELMATGRVIEEERPVYSGRPGLEHVRSTKFPIRDESGAIVGVAGFIADVSAHDRAEKALRETQRWLQAIMDNAPFAVFLKDREGRYRLINRTYTEWFGDRPEDVIGRNAGEVYPSEQVARWEAVDRELVRTGRVAQEERQVLKAKPGLEWVLTTKFPVRDEHGATIGFAGIVDDITSRKRVEIALQESRGLLLESQRIGKLAYILSDTVNDRVVWSDSLFELRQVPRRDWFTFEEAREFIHPDDRPRYLAAREAAIAERRDFEFDVRARHGDGSWGWEHSIVHFRFDENGACLGSLALVQDVTERKRAEEALRHSEERFRALIEHSNDMVTVVAGDGRITYRSPSSAEVMGFREPELVGQSIFDRIHPDDVETIRRAFMPIVGHPDLRAQGRSRVRHQDGSWRTVAWSARDASDVPGIEGIIINSRDVTEAQQLEEQLRESQKMEAVGQLAGGIAHDFNNILGAILGFAGFLLQDLPRETPEHGFAERIVAASERGKELVRQILAFSLRSAVERKPTELAQLAEETRELLRAALPSSTRLEMSLPETRLVADVNAAQINQILFNLCLNANDALQGEPGRIAVSLSRIEGARADRALLGKPARAGEADAEAGQVVFGTLRPGRLYAAITVADSGIGMAPDVLKRIFDPFFTTKGRGRGTGLGLSVVHGIVMAYEGALLVASRPGKGSVFNVYLPLLEAGAEAATSEPRALAALGGRERVLVVDDEIVMSDVLTMALDRLGYETVAINDPEEAINAVAADPGAWDVVISDQVMPGMKGLTLLERLKAIRPSLRFILCTGFSDGATEESAREAGVDAFFMKPAAPEEIATAIRKLFDRPEAAA